jgi:hypothetical protein
MITKMQTNDSPVFVSSKKPGNSCNESSEYCAHSLFSAAIDTESIALTNQQKIRVFLSIFSENVGYSVDPDSPEILEEDNKCQPSPPCRQRKILHNW